MDSNNYSASNAKAAALARLSELGIEYEMVEHPAVFTIEEMDKAIGAQGLERKGMILKNLFLRDANKGRKHFLVLVPGDHRVDLKALKSQIGMALSFASEDRLMRYMGLTKGSVTPLGLMNDQEHAVEVIIERSITTQKFLGVHPNDNTATVWISWDDLKKFIESCGNPTRIIDL